MAEALQTIEYSMLQHGLEGKLIKEVLSEVRSIGTNPFEGLTTSYFWSKYFKETFEYIVSFYNGVIAVVFMVTMVVTSDGVVIHGSCVCVQVCTCACECLYLCMSICLLQV